MLKRFHHWSLKTLGQIRILGTSFVRTAIKVRILPVLSGTAIKIRILPVLYGTAIKVRTRNTAWLTNTRPGKYLLLVQGSAATAALVSISCSWAGSLCTWPTKKVKKWCLTFVRLRLSLFWRLWLLSPALAFVSGSGYCLRLWLRPRGAKDKMEKEKKCHNPLQVRVLYQWKSNHFVEPLSSFLSINITLMNLFQKVIFHWIFSHKCAVAFIIYKWKIVCLNNKTFFIQHFESESFFLHKCPKLSFL